MNIYFIRDLNITGIVHVFAFTGHLVVVNSLGQSLQLSLKRKAISCKKRNLIQKGGKGDCYHVFTQRKKLIFAAIGCVTYV